MVEGFLLEGEQDLPRGPKEFRNYGITKRRRPSGFLGGFIGYSKPNFSFPLRKRIEGFFPTGEDNFGDLVNLPRFLQEVVRNWVPYRVGEGITPFNQELAKNSQQAGSLFREFGELQKPIGIWLGIYSQLENRLSLKDLRDGF